MQLDLPYLRHMYTTSIMMEHLQIWIFKRSIHKMLLLSTRTLRYYNIGGVGGASAGRLSAAGGTESQPITVQTKLICNNLSQLFTM